MLTKIISGGQTGADRAALDVALKFDIPHGGWIPRGRLAEDGRLSDKYNLKEMPTDSYAARTEQNVIDSDGTVIFSHGKPSGGTDYSREMAVKYGKQMLDIDLNQIKFIKAATLIVSWIQSRSIKFLNVAGPRASEDAGIYKDVFRILEKVVQVEKPEQVHSGGKKKGIMILRRLGSTELRVSPIGVGLAALGRPGYINIGHGDDLAKDYVVAAMQARTHDVLDAAFARGVRYFDAARSYGRAEEFLGSWLRQRGISPAEVAVGSKWGYTYTADWKIQADAHEVKEHSLKVLQRQWHESRQNLGPHLDLYQIHSATLESGVLENRAVLDALVRLKGEGVVIGLSVSGSRQGEVIEQSLKLKIDGVRLFDCVQATWNLLEKSAGAALAAAGKMGIGVIVKEALANGRLTERNSEPAFARKLKILKHEAQRLETSVDGLALAAVLAQPWVDVVLSGAATNNHLQSNLKSLDVRWDDQAESELKELLESEETYWKIRSGLQWN
jgi:aryl-alcohol dehydrogenase-like predicted oxidoreductase